ncbi:MAG: hypothetical protein K2W78_12920 [Xanthobacteraceae bacterium]|nr:hypothetical protein [Xanthobacteraceae bacterium]
MKLILDGKLKWVGILGQKRHYQSVLVDLLEVQRAAHALGPETISQREFAKRFGFKKEVAHGLVKHGYVRGVTCERAGYQVTRIPPSEVDAFQQRYVSLAELSRVSGKSHVTVKWHLDQKGIRPAFDPKKVCAHIYRRDDISA